MKTCCIEGCTNECVPNRRYCDFHWKQRRHELDVIQYKTKGHVPHPYKTFVCAACGSTFLNNCGKPVTYCETCRNKYLEGVGSGNYSSKTISGKSVSVHRGIALELGVITAGSNDVVHHLDGDRNNNDRSNLVVISKADHAKLHVHLRRESVLKPEMNVGEESWKYINENGVPHFHCSDDPKELEDHF